MALKIVYENKESAGPTVKVDQRLYLDAAGRLVGEDDPAAVALYCSPGKRVSRADFEARGGICQSEVVAAVAKADAEAAEKAEPKVTKPKAAKKKVTKKKAAKKRATKKKITKKKRS